MRDAWVMTIGVLAPLAIFALAVVLRLAADNQPETTWSSSRRLLFLVSSYVCIGIGFFALLFCVIVTGPLGGIMLILFTLSAAQLVDVELKLAGKRRRARQAELLWLLAAVVRNGGSLANELEMYASGTWGQRHRKLKAMADRIRSGTPLSEIAVPQGLLSRSATIEVQSGLRSGRLYETLRAAAMRETAAMSDESGLSRTGSTLLYPAMVLTASTLVVGFLMYWIIPKFKKIFEDFGTELPDLTKIVIDMSDTVVNYFYIFMPALSLVFMTLAIGGFSELYGWRTVIRFLFGPWLARAHTPDLLRAISQPCAARQPLEQSLQMLAYSSGSWLLQHRVESIHMAVKEGLPCWQQFRRQRFLKSNEVVLLESAQQVGNLPWALQALADAIERSWAYRLRALTELIEPFIIMALGFMIGMLAIAFFLPLVKLLNDLS